MNSSPLIENLSDIVYDHDMFAVHSQVAKMLASEDIIVRWNVRGLGAPASMNFATRVLDIAPIKKDKVHTIPGLILHEVGHFIGSKNVGSSKNGQHNIDTEELQQFNSKIENHDIWNIIEDGYIERLLVAKWPGALKHLRVLYDNDLEVYTKSSKCNLILDIINTLHINVLGVKWGDFFEYPAETPNELMLLLNRARVVLGTHEERAKLSSEITKLIAKLFVSEKKARDRKVVKASVNISVDNIITAPKSIHPNIITNSALNDFSEQMKIDNVLHADVLEQELIKQQREDVVIEQLSEQEQSTNSQQTAVIDYTDEKDVDNDSLEQFISDNKASIIASNEAHVISLVDSAKEADFYYERHIASYEELLAFSSVREIIDDTLKQKLKGISFHNFQRALNNGSGKNESDKHCRRIANLYTGKMLKAKSVAQAMFQRFSSKANAMNISLTKFKQTGSLNPTRAALFKIYDDIFQKKQQAPNQVNHGYVIMVDWSSSMANSSLELFHRVSELVAFAQLAKVEIDIWLYTTNYYLKNDLDKYKGLHDGLLYLDSDFIHILNTKNNEHDAINYGLFAFFINAISAKHFGRIPSCHTRSAETLLGGTSFASKTHVEMRGTNILEALIFAKNRAKVLSCARKAIMILTDGDDNSFEGVYFSKATSNNNSGKLPNSKNINRVMYKNINLLDISSNIVQALSNNFKMRDERLLYAVYAANNIKTIAAFMVAEEARKEGISVIGITWGSSISCHMALWTKNNILRVDVPWKNIRSKSINLYTAVNNDFISKISEALLANIKN